MVPQSWWAPRGRFRGPEASQRGRVVEEGVIESFHDKWLLPGYDVFDEDRWFDSGDEVLHFDLEGKTVAVLCCEDLWHGADAGFPGTCMIHSPC